MTLLDPRTVRTSRAVAEVYDYGAHLWSWSLDGQPVLWQSAFSKREAGMPLRGGIPICWPWFGPGRSGEQTPAHGIARTSDWALTAVAERAGNVVHTYSLLPGDAPGSMLGDGWHVAYEVSVGDELDLALTVANDGLLPFSYELALHTYLAVGDVREVSISGLDQASYLDKVDGEEKVQDGDIRISSETDRVYDQATAVVVSDPVLRRRLLITSEGAASTVVWNPWVAKAAAMPDFGDNEWTSMLCIESGNVLGHAVTLDPGHTATLRYRVVSERA
jgi:glucose-6-phosphate 1-epimerase